MLRRGWKLYLVWWSEIPTEQTGSCSLFSWSTKYNFQIMLAISSKFCIYDELLTYSRNNMIKIDQLLRLLGRMNYIDDNCIVKFDGKWHTVWYMQYIVLVSLLKSHVYWLVELYVAGQGNFQWRRGTAAAI